MVHTSRHRVRVYDVDAFGDLRATTLLGVLQQTASDASTALGFGVDWYERRGTMWVVRRTAVDVLTAPRYGDELAVRTWVDDIRRVRSQRRYEVARASDGAIVVRACSDWVYVDARRATLLQPPEELRRALMPGGVTARPRPARLAASPPPGAFRAHRRVEMADIDTAAHVNNARYAAYVEQALWDALAAHGWTIDPRVAARPQPRRYDLEYLGSARYGDVLEALLWLPSASDTGFECACLLRCESTAVLSASSDWHWKDGAMPDSLRRALAALGA
jgi:acyl-CoA thioesterase FadM